MSQRRILADSNTCFRLAQSIHPLLNVVFGKKRYCLYVIKELQDEYNRSPRLKNAFSWVNDPEYVENRSHFLEITKEEKPEIRRAHDFIHDYVRSVHPGVSKVDVLCLAHAEQLCIPVVTDDEEMRTVAGEYGIATYKTLELLKLMLDCCYIGIDKVREIASYWIYLNDKPKGKPVLEKSSPSISVVYVGNESSFSWRQQIISLSIVSVFQDRNPNASSECG